MRRTVVIDCFPESADFYRAGYAIVAVDVIRATTMAITAVLAGRRCFTVTTTDEAFDVARRLDNPILAGELGGDKPAGFDMSNSPADLVQRTDVSRPIVLLSSSGTQLIARAKGADAIYLSCFRNFSATSQYVAGRHAKVAVIGAGSRKEFREEDQMGCAWVAQFLIEEGFEPENGSTAGIVERWKDAPPSACANGNSAKYLHRSGQSRDLDFILERIDDVKSAFHMVGNELTAAPGQLRVAPLPDPLGAAAPALLDVI